MIKKDYNNNIMVKLEVNLHSCHCYGVLQFLIVLTTVLNVRIRGVELQTCS